MKSSLLNLITKIQRASTQAKKQDALTEYQNERLKAAEQAKAIRPYFLPVLFNKTGVVNNDVVDGTTDANVPYDVHLLGGITDMTARDCQIQDLSNKFFWADKHVNIETFFGFGGNNANTTGRMGMTFFESPYFLPQGKKLGVQIKNATGGTVAVQGYVVFLAQRVLAENAEGAVLDDIEKEFLKDLIKSTRSPRPVRLRANVEFTAASASGVHRNCKTDEAKRPCIITGAYANNVYRSTVEIKLPDGSNMSNSAIPSWAVFQRQGIITSPVNTFRPFYMPKDGTIIMNFINGDVAAGAFDPVQNAGTGVIPNVTWFGYEIG